MEELQSVNLNHTDEDEQLEKKKMVLANIAQLDLAANNAYYALLGGASESESSATGLNTGAIDNVQMALSSLEKVSKFDNDLEPVSDILNNALSLLEDAQSKLRHYKDGLEADPHALQEIEDRVALLASIKRKYGPTLEEAINKLKIISIEMDQLENVANQTAKIESELKTVNKQLNELSTAVNKNRQSFSQKIS